MQFILYSNSKMTGVNFFEALKTCRRNPGRSLSSMIQELRKNERLSLHLFADVLLIAESVRDGTTNPVTLTISLNGDHYVVAPNGDLHRVRPRGDEDDHIPFELAKSVIGRHPVR